MVDLLRRLVRWTGIGLATAAVVVTAILAVVLTTEAGARSVLRQAMSRLAPDLQFEHLRGSLRGPLTLTGVAGKIPPLEFAADRITVDWRPLALLSKRVHVDSIDLVGVRAALIPDSARGEEPAGASSQEAAADTLELPVFVVLDRVQLEEGSFVVSSDMTINDVTATVSGTLTDYRLEFSGTLSETNVGQAVVEGSGRGSLSGVRVEEVRASALDGEVRGSGSATWLPRVQWHATLDGADLTPSFLPPGPEDWPGRLSFAASLDGSVARGVLDLDAAVDTVHGILRGEPVSGALRARMRGPDFLLDEVDLDWGNVRIDASGVVGSDRLDLVFDLDAPDLSEVLPRSGGTVAASGKVGGSPTRPIVIATAGAQDVVLGEFSLRKADARVEVDWHDRGNNDVSLRIVDLGFANQAVDSASLTLSGYRSQHVLRASFASSEAQVRMRGTGGLAGWTWNGEVEELSVEADRAGAWRLDEPATLSASDTAVVLDELCLQSSEGGICFAGSWGSSGVWQLSSSMEELPFSLLRPVLPESYELVGSVDGRVVARGTGDTPEDMEVDLHPGPGSVSYLLEDTEVGLAYRDASIDVRVAGDSMYANATAWIAASDSGQFGPVSAELNLASLSGFIERFMLADSNVVMPDNWTLTSSIDSVSLSLIRPFVPEPWSVDGTVSGELRASGAQRVPSVLELDLRPSPGSIAYGLRDTAAVIDYRDAHLTVRGSNDSLRAALEFLLPGPDGAEVGSVRGEVGYSSLPGLFEEWTREGIVGAGEDGWAVRASIDRVPLSLSGPFLPQNLTLAGTLSGEIDANVAPDGTITGRLELAPHSAATRRVIGRQVNTVRLNDTRLLATAGPEGVRGELTFAMIKPDSVEYAWASGSIALPELRRVTQPLRSQPIAAQLQGELDLTLLDDILRRHIHDETT